MITARAHCKHCSYELGGYKKNAAGYWFVAVVHHEDCPTIAKARAKASASGHLESQKVAH